MCVNELSLFKILTPDILCYLFVPDDQNFFVLFSYVIRVKTQAINYCMEEEKKNNLYKLPFFLHTTNLAFSKRHRW